MLLLLKEKLQVSNLYIGAYWKMKKIKNVMVMLLGFQAFMAPLIYTRALKS